MGVERYHLGFTTFEEILLGVSEDGREVIQRGRV
jgi:hypothetical protein